MKVKCILEKVTQNQISVLGKNPDRKNDFGITVDKEYIVFGLTFYFDGWGNGCFVQIITDNDHLIQVPILLFEVVDNRMSSLWEFKLFSSGTIAMWPPSFYAEFYHDDLFEEIPEIVKDFNKVKHKIMTEFE